jgi:CHAT domain-containing protein
MFRYYFLFFILILLILSPYSQNNKHGLQYEQIYNQAEKLYKSQNANETTDSIALAQYLQVINLLKNQKQNNPTLIDSYTKCGILLMSANKPQEALYYLKQAISAIKNGNNLPDSLLFQPYLYAGSIHYDLNNPDSAVFYYSRAEDINNKSKGLNESERLYNKFGALYYETGDYKKSISYFEKALSIVEEKKPDNTFFIVNYKSNIATALLKLQDYDRALKIFKSILPYHLAEDALFYNIGNVFTELGNFNEALFYLRKMKEMGHQKLNGIAKVFLKLKQYDSAALYVIKAQEIFFNTKKYTGKIDDAVTLKYSGDIKMAGGDVSGAIKNYQLAIISLHPAFTDTSVNSNPSFFSGLQNFSLLFDALVAKSAAFNLLDSLHPSQYYIEQSLNACIAALALAAYIEHTYSSDDARLFLKNKVNPATQQAVAVAVKLYNQSKQKKYLQLAFGFAENNKASVLQAGIQNLKLSFLPGLPESLSEEEKNCKSLIAKLGVQLGRATDSSVFEVIQKKIQETELALSSVQAKLDQNPVYHQLKFNNRLLSIDSIQYKMAGEDEAIISYYYTKDSLLCFYITKSEAGFSSVPLRSNFFSSVAALREGLEKPESYNKKLADSMAAELFTYLIDPVYEKIKNKKHLTILPYNEIGYIPFEMLPDKADGSLLLNRFAVSYNYSASFIADKNTGDKADYNVLAMAPFAEKADNKMAMPSLPASADEISGLPGKKITGIAATRAQFISLSSKFAVIHLATHAMVNDADPLGSYIEFYGLINDTDTVHRLYESEIYNLDMKDAKLVILSACETGNGLLINGEGVMSLSRAFSYAGCKSVITSLWKADDIATAFIIKRLHYYLQKGLAKDAALQNAKIDYLNNSGIEARFKTPAYWAHLVLIGDNSSLVASSFKWSICIPAVIALFLLTALFFKIKARP